MIVESHWRMIKHDYLHRYNRPRIDLVVSTLTSLVVPQAIDKMNPIRSKNHRKAVATWRKTFKKNWDNLQDLSVVPQDLLKYHTNPVKWACACPGFLLSRFLECKHIKNCFEKISDRLRFFSEIQRQRNCPFWTHDQLVIRSEYRSSTETRLDSDDEPSSDSEFYESNLGNFKENTLDSSNAIEQIDVRSEMNVKTYVVEILKQQEFIGNSVFLKVYFEGRTDVASDKNLHEEIQRFKRQRTMLITWSRYKHPAAAFYK